MAQRLPIDAIDAPGHGSSEHDEADLWRSADLIVEAMNQVGPDEDIAGGRAVDPPVLVGYSMGGRMALHVALAHPTAIGGLILIGATAGIDDPDERDARRAADEAVARRLETEPLDAFLTWWLSNPLFAGLSPEAACLPERLTNRPAGLAASVRHCGTGTQEPLWNRLVEITVPVLLLAGSGDEKFTTLSRRLAGSLTGAPVDQRSIDASHAVHLEQGVATAATVLEFVERRCPA